MLCQAQTGKRMRGKDDARPVILSLTSLKSARIPCCAKHKQASVGVVRTTPVQPGSIGKPPSKPDFREQHESTEGKKLLGIALARRSAATRGEACCFN